MSQANCQNETGVNGMWLLPAIASFLLWTGFIVVLWLETVSAAGDLGFALELLGIFGLLASATTSYLVYALVDRTNRHYARTQTIYWASLETLEAKSSQSVAMISVRSAQESVAKLARSEKQRSGILWALLCIIPLAGWIFLVVILWLDSRSLTRHARLEGPVFEDLDRSLQASGLSGIKGGTLLLKSRDILGISLTVALMVEALSAGLIALPGYLVLAFLTIGGISLIWLDLAIRDPIPHFQNHALIDAELERIVPNASSGVTGGA